MECRTCSFVFMSVWEAKRYISLSIAPGTRKTTLGPYIILCLSGKYLQWKTKASEKTTLCCQSLRNTCTFILNASRHALFLFHLKQLDFTVRLGFMSINTSGANWGMFAPAFLNVSKHRRSEFWNGDPAALNDCRHANRMTSSHNVFISSRKGKKRHLREA